MIPVYLCHVYTDEFRHKMFGLVAERWLAEPGCHVTTLTPLKIGCNAYDFQRQRRIWADEHSPSEIYIVADDDCLPNAPAPWASRGVEVLKRHPEFGQLASWVANSSHAPLTTPHFEDDEVMEHASVGQIRFQRKGLLEEWPEQIATTYDSQEAQGLREAGYKVGYIKGLEHLHLGQNYSGIWP